MFQPSKSGLNNIKAAGYNGARMVTYGTQTSVSAFSSQYQICDGS